MRFPTPVLLALSVALTVQASDPVSHWECLDTSGHKVVQDHPCTEDVNFRVDTVPAYVWAIVTVLGVVWLIALMPHRVFRFRATAPTVPELVPEDSPPPVEAQSRAAPRIAPAPVVPVPAHWSTEAVARLSPRRFEELIQLLWQINGYKAVLTGTDVKIHNAATGRLFAVAQCAAETGQPAGAAPIQGLWDAVQQHAAGLGVCYSPAGFASDALMFAQGKRLKLVSGTELLAQIRTLKPEQQKALLEHAWRA